MSSSVIHYNFGATPYLGSVVDAYYSGEIDQEGRPSGYGRMETPQRKMIAEGMWDSGQLISGQKNRNHSAFLYLVTSYHFCLELKKELSHTHSCLIRTNSTLCFVDIIFTNNARLQ